MPITFAHRGARLEAPENTLEAFRTGLALGASGLESDAHLAADGEVVLVHDAVVRHGLRLHRVARRAADELAVLGVPRLAALYDDLGAEFELSLDLKAPGVGEAVLEVARRRGALDRLWLCSPDLDVLEGLLPDAGGAHLVHSTSTRRLDGTLERHAAQLAERRVAVMNLHHSEWTRGIVALFHRFEVAAFAWDVQEERHLRAMLAAGVDGLYSDRVQSMVELVAAWGAG